MLINASRNIVFSADVPIKQSQEFYGKWYDVISVFLYQQLKEVELSFLGCYKPAESIANEFCAENCKIKNYNSTLYYYSSSSLSLDQIRLLVSDSEFYLGNIILIKGKQSLEDVGFIALDWKRELALSGKEIFRMDNDGHSFYCYNPTDDNFSTVFNQFVIEIEQSFIY